MCEEFVIKIRIHLCGEYLAKILLQHCRGLMCTLVLPCVHNYVCVRGWGVDFFTAVFSGCWLIRV